MNKTIFYIGNYKSSIMDAQCQLVLGNCMVLRDLGYQVILIGNDPKEAKDNPKESKKTILGFDFFNITFNISLKGVFQIKSKGKEIRSILEMYQIPEAIIFYGSPGFALQQYDLISWSKKYRVKIISNCSDISSLAHGSFIERIIKRIDTKLKENFIIKNAHGIIAVSSYIKNYYTVKRNKPVVVVPPLKDINEIPQIEKKNKGVIQLVYMGVPFPIDGRKVDEEAYKDRIDLFIDLLVEIKGKTKLFCFNIYGLTEDQYLSVVSRHKKVVQKNRDIIKFHGRIPYEDSLKCLANADFSVVYRTINQMTMAGFSSKLVESICCGAPVIITDTSDYKKYIADGKLGFFLEQNNHEVEKQQLIQALNSSIDEKFEMKKHCLKSKIFDYHGFIPLIEKFLQEF